MTSYEKYNSATKNSNSLVCVGLDSSIDRMPDSISKDLQGLLDFNKAIIDSTKEFCLGYKLNFAFYEQYGSKGIEILEKTFDYIPNDKFTIADAKRGDIGNTAKAYAKSIFEHFNADSATINPYMGMDTIEPFADYHSKIFFALGLTSNQGAQDFEWLVCDDGALYEEIIKKISGKFSERQAGFVVGATHPEELARIRTLIPENLLLIPGVGAQGGNLKKVMIANKKSPIIINSSRQIIYASDKNDFDKAAATATETLRNQINELR